MKKNESYENMMERLESILEELEGGEVTLEDSIKKYEEGVKLCAKLKNVLKSAETKIYKITEECDKEFKVDEEG